MNKRNIVIGQKVNTNMAQRARELRWTMTEAEKALWQALRTNRLEGWHFRRQQVIDSFIVDFYCHAAGLVVEVDGDIHVTQRDQDAERDQLLALRGLRVVRFTNQEVIQHLDQVIFRILTACKSSKQVD